MQGGSPIPNQGQDYNYDNSDSSSPDQVITERCSTTKLGEKPYRSHFPRQSNRSLNRSNDSDKYVYYDGSSHADVGSKHLTSRLQGTSYSSMQLRSPSPRQTSHHSSTEIRRQKTCVSRHNKSPSPTQSTSASNKRLRSPSPKMNRMRNDLEWIGVCDDSKAKGLITDFEVNISKRPSSSSIPLPRKITCSASKQQ